MKKFIIPLIIFVFLIILSWKVTFQDSTLSKIKNSIEIEKKIDFKEFTDFDWDSMLVIYPYSIINEQSNKYNIDLSIVSKDIEKYDKINTLVFIKDKKAIDYIEIPREYFNFKSSEGLIKKEDAKFLVVNKSYNNENYTFLELIKQ